MPVGGSFLGGQQKELLDYTYGRELLAAVEAHLASRRDVWSWSVRTESYVDVDVFDVFARIETPFKGSRTDMLCKLNVRCHSPNYCYVGMLIVPPPDSHETTERRIDKSSRNMSQVNAQVVIERAFDSIVRAVKRADPGLRCDVFRRRIMSNVRLSF